MKEELENLLEKRNVIGYSNTKKPKIKNGEELDEEAWRIYVEKKEREEDLPDSEIVPQKISGTKTDIVEKKPFRAPPEIQEGKEYKTDRFRPLKLGISIGNYAISAGTNGWPMKELGENEILLGTNAHVGSDDPTGAPEEVEEKRIVQPGKHDGGEAPRDKVGEYRWHKKVHVIGNPSDCPLSKIVIKILNGVSKLLGRKTRFKTEAPEVNKIDFAVWHPEVEYSDDIVAFPEFSPEEHKLVGFLFAGSDDNTIVCKQEHIEEEGYVPVGVQVAESLEPGDTLIKSGRTTCKTEFDIEDESARVRVFYGNGVAEFDDVLMCGPGSDGGDSGSAVFLEE